ncbi:MAG: hypothetical protein AAFU77_07010 [Myxococcota bacterium]
MGRLRCIYAACLLILVSCSDSNELDELSCNAGQIAAFDGETWACADLPDVTAQIDTLANLSCDVSQVAAYDGTSWICQDQPSNQDRLASLDCSENDIIVFNGTDWVCGTDEDFLGQLSCNLEDVLVYDGTNWVCRPNAFEELVPTRADAIATSVTASRSDNSMAINHGAADDFDGVSVFPSSDGAGIIAWLEGDDGDEHTYLAYYGPEGGVINQSPVRGDFGTNDTFDIEGDVTNTMVVVWAPNGDAFIAFIAAQGFDPADPAAEETSRVYFGRFSRSLATTPRDGNDVRYGFSRFEAIGTDADEGVTVLYVASNLVDGAWIFGEDGPPRSMEQIDGFVESTEQEMPTNPYFVSGSKGDDAASLTPTAFLGWIYRNDSGGSATEGVYIDVNDLDGDQDFTEVLSTATIPLPLPGLDNDEELDRSAVTTSGTDILLSYDDGTAPGQERLFLIRAPAPATPAATPASPVEISRGTNTHDQRSTIEVRALIGDGYRALNGETTTWVIYDEREYTDGTVTNDDRDLLVAQVGTDGTVEVGEFDHVAPDAVDAFDVSNVTVQLHPGATRAFLYYQQQFAPTVQVDLSLFVRALRLDGTQSLANNVSNEVTLNESHDSDGDFDADVDAFKIITQNAFFGHSANNNASYAVFRQLVDEVPDAMSLKARLVTIDDPAANPITLSAVAEETIVANHDVGYDDTSFTTDRWFALPGSTSDGRGVVYFIANGNTPSDASAGFVEPRPFVYAPSLPNGHSVPSAVQIGSDSFPGGVDFADYRRIGGSTYWIQAVATPFVPAERDFLNDAEENPPERIVLVAEEFVLNEREHGSTYVTRSLDLRNDNSIGGVAARWSPALTTHPATMGPDDGEESDDLDAASLLLLPEGNDVVAVFNTSHHEDGGPGEGGYIFVNSYTAGEWSDAALLSNDSTFELDDTEQPFRDTGMVFGYAPSFVGGAPRAVGSFTFWLRWQHNNGSTNYRFELRGRRLTGVQLPRR